MDRPLKKLKIIFSFLIELLILNPIWRESSNTGMCQDETTLAFKFKEQSK